jgi:hypothetical protein
MFKFIKQYAETITNANIYPLVSLLIFFVFCGITERVKRMKKEKVNELANIPFEKEELSNSNS